MNLKNWQITGAVFTIIVGTLLHFTYQWSGKNQIVGYFSAVNESTFEHLKLLITPMLLWGIIEYWEYGRQIANFIPVRFLSILIGITTIIVLFYTYVGIVGEHFLLADILVFVIGVITAYCFSLRVLNTACFTSQLAQKLAIAGIILIPLCFVLFTYHPPGIGLFKEPETTIS